MGMPNFFIIGHPKSGTSALTTFLNQHDDVFFPKNRMLYYFDTDLYVYRKNYNSKNAKTHLYNFKLEQYLDNYKHGCNQKIFADGTVTYLHSKNAAGEIFKFNPEAKILAIFREPVSFLYSLHSQNVWNLYEDQKNFKKALELEDLRKRGECIPENGKHARYLLFYSEMIKYRAQLQRFTSLFPKNQILVLLFEDYKKNNSETLKKICDFLCIDKDFDFSFDNINPNKIRQFTALKKLSKKLANTKLSSFIPAKLYYKSANLVDRFTTIKAGRTELDPDFKNSLKKSFLNDVIEFEEFLKNHSFIDRNFSLVKYWDYENF